MTDTDPRQPQPVLTIGHSTRTLAELMGVLRANGIECVADVRTVPRSRRNPQFNIDTLPFELAGSAISYRHMPGLGGLRRPKPGSPNTGWRNDSFRGYADHMQTAEFHENLSALIELAARSRTAVMCAESVPWRCHRALIADALLVKGIPVEHILDAARRCPHRLTPWASIRDGQILYPQEEGECRWIGSIARPGN